MIQKDGFNRFIGVVVLLVILTLAKSWFNYSFAFVWLGVLTGYYFPFLDYVFYAYIIRPDAEVSRNIRSKISAGNLVSLRKNKELISFIEAQASKFEKFTIHTAYFQVVFVIVTFFILSSSTSFFGRGMVYGIFLALFAEQTLAFLRTKNINRWFADTPFLLDYHQTKVYLYANAFVLLIFTIML